MTTYSAILFDVDDTLLDFRASEDAACRMVVDLYTAAGVAEDVFLDAFREASDTTWDLYMEHDITRAQVADTTFEHISRLLPGPACVDAHVAAIMFSTAFADHSVSEPGATAVLAGLHTQYVTGVISNHEQPTIQRQRLAACGLAQFLDVVVISGDVGVEKPDPAIFDRALHLLGMTAEQCLFVGDSIASDGAGARGAGMDFCWYRRHHAPPYAPTTAVKVIESLAQLDAFLDAPDPLVRRSAG